jgi:biopolymer transport protein ExbB/TolQ
MTLLLMFFVIVPLMCIAVLALVMLDSKMSKGLKQIKEGVRLLGQLLDAAQRSDLAALERQKQDLKQSVAGGSYSPPPLPWESPTHR